MRTARAAEQRKIPLSSHLSPEYSAHVLAASSTCHWLEFMDWAQELIRDPLVPEKGIVRPRDTPGAGIAWNDPVIEKCRIST
jgi:mandelate racemase